MDAAQRNQPRQAGLAPGMDRSSSNRSTSSLPVTQRLRRLEVASLEDFRDSSTAGQRLFQRATEKRMVVGDDEPVASRQSFLPVRLFIAFVAAERISRLCG